MLEYILKRLLGKEFNSYLPTEFLLELPNKADVNLAESFSQPVGDMDNNSLLVS